MHVHCVARDLHLRETVLADCELFIKRCSVVSIVKAEVETLDLQRCNFHVFFSDVC